jgi:hypothetical protein
MSRLGVWGSSTTVAVSLGTGPSRTDFFTPMGVVCTAVALMEAVPVSNSDCSSALWGQGRSQHHAKSDAALFMSGASCHDATHLLAGGALLPLSGGLLDSVMQNPHRYSAQDDMHSERIGCFKQHIRRLVLTTTAFHNGIVGRGFLPFVPKVQHR